MTCLARLRGINGTWENKDRLDRIYKHVWRQSYLNYAFNTKKAIFIWNSHLISIRWLSEVVFRWHLHTSASCEKRCSVFAYSNILCCHMFQDLLFTVKCFDYTEKIITLEKKINNKKLIETDCCFLISIILRPLVI